MGCSAAWLRSPIGTQLFTCGVAQVDCHFIMAVVLQRINALSLGYALFRITHDIERLPYPMAYVQAGGATALAETSSQKEGWRWHVYRNVYRGSMGAFLCRGAHPVLGFLTETVSVLPIPFIDFFTATDEICSSCGGSWIGDRPNTRPHWPCFTILGCSWRVCFLNYSQYQ